MRFFYEVEFELDWSGYFFPVTYTPDHPEARVVDVFSRTERDAQGRALRTVGVLLVRDSSSSRHPVPKQVLVCRKQGRITELSDWVGDYVGTFPSDQGRDEWYVFEARSQPVEERRPAAAPPAAPAPRSAPALPPPPWTEAPTPATTAAPAAPADEWLAGLT